MTFVHNSKQQSLKTTIEIKFLVALQLYKINERGIFYAPHSNNGSKDIAMNRAYRRNRDDFNFLYSEKWKRANEI